MSKVTIASAQNAKLKLVRALAGRSRERREAGAFLAEGVRLVEEALASGWPFRYVLFGGELTERGRNLVARLRERGIETAEISEKLLASLSETETSQGLLAVLEEERGQRLGLLNNVLITDALRDPGNLGTLLRSAEAAGIEAVLLTPGTADAFAPKVVRAAMGAHFRLPLFEVNWGEIRTQASTYDWSVYLADKGGQSLWEADFTAPMALIVGAETEGVSAEARRLATHTVSIPMQGQTESLNAAVAGSILMFEAMRRRRAATRDTTLRNRAS